MNRETLVLALPAILRSNLDGPEDGWLLIENDHHFTDTLVKALLLEDCLRQHDLIATRFLTGNLFPATRMFWGEEPMCMLIDNLRKSGHWNNDKPTSCNPERKTFQLPALEVIEKHLPPDHIDLIPTDGSFWMEVNPLAEGGVGVELYTYEKHTGRRIFSELPDELLERARHSTKRKEKLSKTTDAIH